MSSEGLERLDAWRKAKDYALLVYAELLKCLPVEEKWGLNSQIRRAVQSIPANIAEGYGRFYFQETIRFCYTARGSLEETLSHLILAHQLGYLPDDPFNRMIKEGDALGKLINGYIAYLKRARLGEHEPGASSIAEESAPYPDFPDPTEQS